MNNISKQSFSEQFYFYPRMMFGGTDWGEIVLVSNKIKSSLQKEPSFFWKEWHAAWCEHADRLRQGAVGLPFSEAGILLKKAAAALHWAEFMFFQDVEAKAVTRASVSECFCDAQLLDSPENKKVNFLHNNKNLPGYVFHAVGKGPHPTVILLNGLDSAKEVELYKFSQYFVSCGITCIVFDGPGQGENLADSAMPLDFSPIVRSVISSLGQDPRIDINRLGLFGVSFGGYLALQCAASTPEVKAVVNLSGAFDVRNYASINPRVRHDFRYVFKVDDDSEMENLARRFLSVAHLPPIKRNVLCIHGGRDSVFPPENCERIRQWIGDNRTRTVLYPYEEHVCQNYFFEFMPQAALWMAEQLRA